VPFLLAAVIVGIVLLDSSSPNKKQAAWLGGATIALIAVFSVSLLLMQIYYMFMVASMFLAIIVITLNSFYISANSSAITAAFGDKNKQKNALRNLRTANLCLGIAGILYLPPLAWVGVAYVLTQLDKHVQPSIATWTSTKRWAIALTVTEIVCWSAFAGLLGAQRMYQCYAYTSPYTGETYYSTCYISAFEQYWYIWPLLYLIRSACVIGFMAVSDRMTLRLIENMSSEETVPMVGRVVQPSPLVAAAAAPAVTVSPCAACSAPLQFTRNPHGPTSVQCYQCNAIVEFTPVDAIAASV